jgi:hypothetical protein
MFELRIHLNHPAFVDYDNRSELARLLRDLADTIDAGPTDFYSGVIDLNGHMVGTWDRRRDGMPLHAEQSRDEREIRADLDAAVKRDRRYYFWKGAITATAVFVIIGGAIWIARKEYCGYAVTEGVTQGGIHWTVNRC